MRTVFLCVALFLLAVINPALGRTLFSIDTFASGPGGGVVFAVPYHNTGNNYWWTPFNYSTALGEDRLTSLPGSYKFHTVDYACGGQRDLILGFEETATPGTSATLAIVSQAANIGFSLFYVGGAYFQWDGTDTGPFTTPGGIAIDKGIFLHDLPGIGSHTSATVTFPNNGDGRSQDWTVTGRAYGITIETQADHLVFYYVDVVDANGDFASYDFEAEQTNFFVRRWIPFDDPNWSFNDSTEYSLQFDWTKVVAIQVRTWTFSDVDGPGNQESTAIDTIFRFLEIFGSYIPGFVENDCACDASGDTPVVGATVNLYQGTLNSGTPLSTTTTDATGYFEFTRIRVNVPIEPGTQYTVCLADRTRQCTGDTGCRTLTTPALPAPVENQNNNIDPIALHFYYTAPEGLNPPSDRTIECGACNTTACLGCAVATQCSGADQQVCDKTDTVPTGPCPYTFRRTFSFDGRTAVQTITIVDTTNPTLLTAAQPGSTQCASQGSQMNDWVNTRGGATATDCTGVVWTNNWNGVRPTCGSQNVVFTATDDCGNSITTSSTYTIDDTINPTISTQAQSQTVECNRSGSDLSALTTWLNNNGGAVASDNCGTTTFSNNYVTGSLTRPSTGCVSSIPVIFTASDPCLNVATTSATFTISDTTAPVINPQASSQTGDCGGSGTSFSSWLDARGGAQATDACSSVTWTNNASGGGGGGCSDSRPIIFTATDVCGLSATTSATFTLSDNSPPTITTQPTPLSVQCSAADRQAQINAWLNNNGGATATDTCTAVTWTNNFTTGTGNCNQVPVVFTACDACASSTTDATHCRSVTSSYTIVDTQAPTFSTPPASSSAECNASARDSFSAWLASNAGAIATDNCSVQSAIVISNNWPVGTLPALGCNVVSTVQFVARDECGQTSAASTATFTINDTQNPTFTTLPSDQSVPCNSQAQSAYQTWLNNRAGAVATDTCTGSASVTASNAPANFAFDTCSGTTTVTFVARDTCGLTASATARFIVADDTPPVINPQASDLNIQCTSGSGQTNTALTNWVNTRGGAQATDACSAVTWSNTTPALSTGCDASTTVTFTASDACGLTARTTATFSQVDNVGPTITTPAQSRTVPCDSQTGTAFAQWVSTQGGAVAVDACQVDPITWDAQLGDGIVGCDFETVTFIASDSCGFSTSTSATFTSVDNTPPTFSPQAADLTVECSSNGNSGDFTTWINSHGGAVAVDACALGQFTWTSSVPASNGGPVGCGSVTVTFSVTDNCNNVARTTATYTVRDSTNPIWAPAPQTQTVECDGNGNQNDLTTWVSSRGGGSATDSCSASSAITYTQNPGTQSGDSCRSVRPYTFVARDACGNSASATAEFIIRDSSRPELVTPAANASFECDGNGNQSQVNSWVSTRGGAVADDMCQATLTWTNTFPQQGPLPCSTISVTFTATDACSFTVSTTATLSITDDTPPVFSFFPNDVVVPCDADISEEILGRAEAFDICAGELFVSSSETSMDEPPVGNCPGDHVVTRTFSAVDECGNSISDSQTIRVQIVRSSGPCDPEGCECDACCPPPQASNCLPAPCQASNCQAVPCTATACTCAGGSVASREVRQVVDDDLIEPLPQCKPVYIYVNDDDDSVDDKPQDALVAQQRMLVTSEPLHESAFRNKSGASTLVFSFLMLAIVLFLF